MGGAGPFFTRVLDGGNPIPSRKQRFGCVPFSCHLVGFKHETTKKPTILGPLSILRPLCEAPFQDLWAF